MKQLIGCTVADVSLKEKVGYDAVLGALERQVSAEVNWDEVHNIGTIGIDEVFGKKRTQELSRGYHRPVGRWDDHRPGSIEQSKKRR
jgi:hypothetical protein